MHLKLSVLLFLIFLINIDVAAGFLLHSQGLTDHRIRPLRQIEGRSLLGTVPVRIPARLLAVSGGRRANPPTTNRTPPKGKDDVIQVNTWLESVNFIILLIFHL
jgi:hypothetical protein